MTVVARKALTDAQARSRTLCYKPFKKPFTRLVTGNASPTAGGTMQALQCSFPAAVCIETTCNECFKGFTGEVADIDSDDPSSRLQEGNLQPNTPHSGFQRS